MDGCWRDGCPRGSACMRRACPVCSSATHTQRQQRLSLVGAAPTALCRRQSEESSDRSRCPSVIMAVIIVTAKRCKKKRREEGKVGPNLSRTNTTQRGAVMYLPWATPRMPLRHNHGNLLDRARQRGIRRLARVVADTQK